MLTKNLLKFSVRGDKICPRYLKVGDPKSLEIAKNILEVYKRSVGYSERELTESLSGLSEGKGGIAEAFAKILSDRLEYSEISPEIEGKRWDLFEISKKLRGLVQEEFDFKKGVESSFGVDFVNASEIIYSDLEEYREIKSFQEISPEDLIHKFNLAQVQGHLIRARQIKFDIEDSDLIKRRRFMRKLKQYNLLSDVVSKEGSPVLSINVSGPTAIFDHGSAYGLRLSNFFPYVLLFSKWRIGAVVKSGDRDLNLEVDSNRKFVTHYKDFTGYLPEEFRSFRDAVNESLAKSRPGWKVSVSYDLINLGYESYSFPDLTFEHESGKKMHLELFHRWHASEFAKRLRGPMNDGLILGASDDVLQNTENIELFEEARSRGVRVLRFKNFPTPRAIMAYL